MRTREHKMKRDCKRARKGMVASLPPPLARVASEGSRSALAPRYTGVCTKRTPHFGFIGMRTEGPLGLRSFYVRAKDFPDVFVSVQAQYLGFLFGVFESG